MGRIRTAVAAAAQIVNVIGDNAAGLMAIILIGAMLAIR